MMRAVPLLMLMSLCAPVCCHQVCIRFVANQDHQRLTQLFEDFVRYEFAKLHSHNSLHITVSSHGPAWMGDPRDCCFQAAARAIRSEWGVEPMYIQVGEPTFA